jgi:hypothetical protein
MHLSAGLAHRFQVIDSLIKDACVSSYKQTVSDLFLEPQDCNKGTTHSDTLSVFHHLQSWLCVGMFCMRTMFCERYMGIHVLMSLIIVSDSDSDAPTISSHKQCDLLVH